MVVLSAGGNQWESCLQTTVRVVVVNVVGIKIILESFIFMVATCLSVVRSIHTILCTMIKEWFWPTVSYPLAQSSILALSSVIICDPSTGVM